VELTTTTYYPDIPKATVDFRPNVLKFDIFEWLYNDDRCVGSIQKAQFYPQNDRYSKNA
jgi:hypothetical protein